MDRKFRLISFLVSFFFILQSAVAQPSPGTSKVYICQGNTCANVTGSNALKVDGSAVTQPVSGTVSAAQSGTWNINNISGTVSLPTGAATESTLSTRALESGGNLASLASTVSGSRIQSNIAQIGGNTIDTNSGNKSNGTIRNVQATDQPEMTNSQPVKSKQIAATTDTITSIGDAAIIALNGELRLDVQLRGTYTSVQDVFECSRDGGSTYQGIYGYNELLFSRSTQTAIDTNQTRNWFFDVSACTHFKVRCVSFGSGSQTVSFIPVPLGQGYLPVVVTDGVSTIISSTNYTASEGNSAPNDGVQLGFDDLVNGDFHFWKGANGGGYVILQDENGSRVAAKNSSPGGSDVGVVARLGGSTNAVGRVGHDTTGLSDNRKTISSAGTRETLASSTAAKWVTICAETDNTGLVVVGGSTVVASLSTRRGLPLYAGDCTTLQVDDLVDVYLDVTVSGDGVTYLYGT